MTGVDWSKYLDENVHDRLCECRNTKKDIFYIARALKIEDKLNSKEALEYALEWIGDWNGQYNVTDLTVTEYDRILKRLERV